jgi:hypothetical protein
MLFDLRSRGRRTTVRVIYGSLALLMVVGLVGLGIGTGSTGGILDASQSSGSGGGDQISDTALKKALAAVKKTPSAANWASVMTARWSDAGSGSNYDTSTSTYTAGGKKQLKAGADAWQQYLKVASSSQKTGTAFLQNSFLAAEIYQALQQYSNETEAWNYAVQASGGGQQAYKPYLCLAFSSYAAKQTAKGNLAAAKAVALTPKADRLTTKSTLKSASTSATTAQEGLAADC